MYNDQIIAGMGVPTGFFYGEAQYSGASVNLRALENEFLGNRQDMMRLVDFIIAQLSAFLGIPRVEAKFRPFKMADDMHRASFDLNLANSGFISRRTFLEGRDFDYDTEQELIHHEGIRTGKIQRENMVRQTEAQGESMLIQTRFQVQAQALQQEAQANMQPPPQEQGAQQQQPPEAQQGAQQQQQAPQPEPQAQQQQQQQQQPADPQMMQQPTQEQMAGVDQSQVNMQSSGGMVDLFAQAKRMTSELRKMNEVDRYRYLSEIRNMNPDLYTMVNNALGSGGAPMKPLPEQRPPRRGPGSAQI